MTIRFLQTTASENPDFPFQPGQVVTVACPTPFLLDAIARGEAEVVKTDETERAIAPEPETAEPVTQKGRRRASVH